MTIVDTSQTLLQHTKEVPGRSKRVLLRAVLVALVLVTAKLASTAQTSSSAIRGTLRFANASHNHSTPGNASAVVTADAPTCADDYHSPLSFSRVLEHLRRERIFFLGDSLLRYQYTSIAYYVTTRGLWRHPVRGSEPPNEDANQFGKDARLRYFTESTKRLRYEVCDCYRGMPRSNRGYWQTTREARYYNNTRDGVTLYFIFQMGTRPLTLHTWDFLQASCAPDTGCRQQGCAPGHCDARRSSDLMPPVANEELWVREICRLKPTVVVLNMGKWGKVEGPLAVPLLRRTRERVLACIPKRPVRLIWWRTTLFRDEIMRYHNAMRLRFRELASGVTSPSARGSHRNDSSSRGGRHDDRESLPWDGLVARKLEQELWPETDAEIASNISTGRLPGWELWDQNDFIRHLVRQIESHTERDRTQMSSVFIDNAHYTPPVVAALSRNMLLRLFGCAIRGDEPGA